MCSSPTLGPTVSSSSIYLWPTLKLSFISCIHSHFISTPSTPSRPCGCEYPTPAPTSASGPYPTCDICGASNMRMTTPNGSITIMTQSSRGRTSERCSVWQEQGNTGQISPSECRRLQRIDSRENDCGCEPIMFQPSGGGGLRPRHSGN